MYKLVDLLFGVVIGMVISTAISFAIDKKIYIELERAQRKCLWPVSDGTFTFEPYSKTCFSIEGDVKKPVDCNTVLTIKQFQIVKHCF